MAILPNARIAILGGAGKVGRPLVQQVLTAGYQVRLLLRQPEQFDLVHEHLDIIQSDARNPTSLQQLLQGCQALISTLGNPRGERTPMLSAVTSLILSAMQEAKLSRYIVVSSYYGTDKPQTDAKTKQAAAFMQAHFPQFMDDRRAEYHLSRESNLEWTYVRLPYLVEGSATGITNVNVDYLPGQQITGADLAQFLVSQLTDHQYIRQSLFVAN